MNERASQEYHVIIDRDDDGNPVYILTKPNRILDAIVAGGLIARWQFTSHPTPSDEYTVYVYNAHSPDIPQGENLEEINRRAVQAIEAQ